MSAGRKKCTPDDPDDMLAVSTRPRSLFKRIKHELETAYRYYKSRERRNAGYRLGIAPTVGAMYDAFVKVIARATLYRFVENRVARKLQKAVKAHLEAWYAEAERATWKNSAELKSQYRSASVISAERVVFNIKGNEFRLIVAINYHYQVLLIKWLGTHKEYDEIDAGKVEYDKHRYTNPSHSDGE